MAVLFTLLLGVSAGLIGYFLYDFGKQNFIRETEAAIDNEIAHILAINRNDKPSNITQYIQHRTDTQQAPIYLYQDKYERLLAGNITSIPNNVTLIKEGVISFMATFNKQTLVVAAKIHTFSNGSKLLIARDIHAMMQSYDLLQWFSILIMVFMLLVILISFFISVFVVSRINKISLTAQHIIQTGDLSKRIKVDSRWDDLSYLATTLNQLLARIESLMHTIRDVSDNIAHDLRTPVTHLRNQLENLKHKELSQTDITNLIGKADHILSIFNSLLRIANIEKGQSQKLFKNVNIQTILQDVIELYDPLAEAKHIGIQSKLNKLPDMVGDRDLLFQMFANLLDNAIKFSSDKSTITLFLTQQNKRMTVVIADNGIGIDKHEADKIFGRFYRSDKSRHTLGCGLGLSLVKAVADMHKIILTCTDNNPGFKITLSLQG
jgi:signal transduction histidine kinase